MNEIFQILMQKYTHNQCTTHKYLKYPGHSPLNLFGSLLTITYRSLPNWHKAFRKTSIDVDIECDSGITVDTSPDNFIMLIENVCKLHTLCCHKLEGKMYFNTI